MDADTVTEPTVGAKAQPATAAGLLRVRAAERPEKVAFTFLVDGEIESDRLTYAELDRRARAIAGRLRRTVAPGERALLLYPPGPPGLDFIAAFFGCLYAGVVAVPAYPPRVRDRAQERLRAIARDAEPKAALTTAALLASLVARPGELAGLAWIATDEIPAEGDLAELPEPEPESIAFLQYTSGSTSTPKGVMVTHANLLHNERMIGAAFGQDEESVVAGWLPLYHDMGLIGNVLQPVHAGASCVLMAPVAFLQRPARWLEAISRYRATTSGGPNFAYELCARKVSAAERAGLDLSSWRVAFNGAEPVRESTLSRFAEVFGPCGFRPEAFYPCYGLAEATLFVSGGERGRAPRVLAVDGTARWLVSCGRAWDGQRVVTVEPESGLECLPGRVGEIWVAGPSVAQGYWRNAEATARDFGATLTTLTEDSEGPYLRTGDLGFVADGELYVTGRIKDLVILRGRNHYPQDLELTAERAHPDLRPGSGAAFSVEGDGEERLVLVQEVERRFRGEVEEVAAAIRRAVAEEHEVQVWEVVLVRPGAVPKTSSGKVRRGACRAAYLAGELPVVGRSAVAAVDGGAEVGALTRADLLGLVPEERRGALESWLRASAARLLGVPAAVVEMEKPLTGLGLDSLSAVELKGAAESALGVEIPLADLLAGASLGEVVGRVLEEVESSPPGPLSHLPTTPSPGEGEKGDAPLSFGQRSLWFLERLAPEAGAYNIAVAARVVSGELNVAALERALERLVQRHEALRTVFLAPEGVPVQRVLEGEPPTWPPPLPTAPRPGGEEPPPARILEIVDVVGSEGEVVPPPLGGGVVGSGGGQVGGSFSLSTAAWRPFDLEHGPLLRVLVGRGETPVVLFVVHHIVSDFWSLAVMARELSALYREETGGPPVDLAPLPVRYTDFARWQAERLAGPRGEALWAWWRERLSGLPDLALPIDRQRPPVQTWRGLARGMEIPAAEAEAVRSLAARHGATLFAALLTAFQVQLGRYSGQEDFAVGSPTAGRGLPEVAGVVGYFVNPMVLRADLGGAPSFGAFLEQARRTAVEGLAHAELPFALLAERLRPVRDPARPPVFQALFVLEQRRVGDPPGMPAFSLGEDGARLPFADLELESVRLSERRAQLELSLSAAELPSGGLGLSLELNADLFDGPTAERMLGHLRTLLAAAAADPVRPIDSLPLLTPGERVQLTAEWAVAPEVEVPSRALHELVAESARRTPEAEAVTDGRTSLTYRELVERSRELAARLRRLGVEPEVPVALCVERSPWMIVGLLGILEAGGVYLPLDPEHSAARLAFVLEDARVAALVTDSATAPRLPETGVPRVLFPSPPGPLSHPLPPAGRGGNFVDREVQGGEGAPLSRGSGGDGRGVGGEGLAYLIYTSGSTGRPKGVAVPHGAAVAHCLTWARLYGMTEADRVLQFASASFDASVEQIFSTLLSGATLVMRGPEPWGTRDLPRRIAALDLTIADFPTAFWHRWVHDLEEVAGVPGRLRLVGIGGEELLAESARVWNRSPLAPVRLLNSYGPTESVVTATLYEVRPGDGESGPVPIGRALPGRVARVVDLWGNPQPVGIPGELWIGEPLARGYLGRPELTAERFVPDPFAEAPGARLYRTGDLVRRRIDGELEFLGRTDNQVKVRGFRIEPGEIEAVLLGHPVVREAAVLAEEGPGGEKQLVGFVSPEGISASVLREHLRRSLPDYMVPAAWVLLPELPLNASGKVDRARLRELVPAEVEGEVLAAPRTPEKELLAGIFAELLGRERVGVEDDFFALGGHSLLATRVVSRISRVFGVDLPVSAVFQDPTAGRLAARLAGAAEAAPPIVPVPRGGALPLSFAQRRLWFLDQLEPGTAIYNVPGTVRLTGALDVAALREALSAIVRRHEALRTVFPARAGEPVQVIQAPGPAMLPVLDLSGLPAAARRAEAGRRAREEAARPFDLGRGPVFRASLVRSSGEEHLLLVTLHHIVSDGWSLGLFLDELSALSAEALPVQYADYAVWQERWMQGAVLERQLGWWRERLTGLPVLELPADRPRPAVRDSRGGSRSRELPAELMAAAGRLSRSQGATLFMTLLGVFQALLARYTGEDVIPVGSPVANRERPETERLIGLFVNTLVLPARVGDDPTVSALLARVREVCLGAYAHQEVPFEKLVEELAPARDLSQNPLFQVMFALEEPLPGREAGGVAFEPVRGTSGTARFDLLLTVTPAANGAYEAITEHAAALFEPATIERLLGHWTSLLAGAAADPGARISDLPLLSPGERAQIVVEWNDTRTDLPEGLRLHDLVRAQAERTPDATAVVGEEVRISYRELMERSWRIAGSLRRLGIGPERRVGICLRRTPDMVAAILGVLEAGGAYVPLDPAYPAERIELMATDSGAEVLLTESAVADRVAFAPGAVLLDRMDWAGASPAPTPADEASDRNMAYVIYTSGSTGRPKGVPIEHRSAVTLVAWAVGLFPREDLEGVLMATSICFDLSIFELFVPLSVGGRVILADNALALPQLAAIHEVTLVNAVPSPMAELVRGRLPAGLRTVNLAGEALKADLAEKIYAHPQVERVYNLYGPTEDTTYSTGSLVPRDTTAPAIGRPLTNSHAYVLGRHGELLPIGAAGELCLGGDGLARGYLGRPDLTAEKFVPDPFGDGTRLYRTGDRARLRAGGEIDYLGRADFQIKLHGIRIELGEIEATLHEHPAVRAAVVQVRTDGPGGTPRLVAYLVFSSAGGGAPGEGRGSAGPAQATGSGGGGEGGAHTKEPSRAGRTLDPLPALREWLAHRLPAAMVPSVWIELDALPLSPNGKVDRRRLPAPDWHGRNGRNGRNGRDGGLVPPRTPAEEKVAAAFRDSLGLPQVGAFDSFFDLGGHSLLALRAAFRLSEAFGVDVPVAMLFQAPTVAALAERLAAAAPSPSGLPALIRLDTEGPFPLSLAQQRLWLLDRLEPGDPVYHLWVPVRLTGELSLGPLRRSLAEIVRRHEPLRTVYAGSDGEPVQIVLPPSEPAWSLLDLTSLPAEHQDPALASAFDAEARHPFDLERGPVVRFLLARLDSAEHVLLVSVHHIAADGWSLDLLFHELGALYGAFAAGLPSPLPELPLRYADYAVWQRQTLAGEVLERQLAFWREALAALPVLELPTDRHRPLERTTTGAGVRLEIPPERIDALRALGRSEGTTLFATLLAGFMTLLARTSGQDDFAVGVPEAGRGRAETEGLIGFFVNTLALRAPLVDEPDFRALVHRVNESLLAARAHGDVPFERLVEELHPDRATGHPPLVQVLFGFLSGGPDGRAVVPGLTLSLVEVEAGPAAFDLALQLHERKGLVQGWLGYRTDLLEPATASRMAGHFLVLLRGAAETPDLGTGELPLLTEGERHQLRVEWNETEREVFRGQEILSRIEAWAAQTPEAVALVHGGEHLTYGELDRRAGRLARRLRRLGLGTESRVGLWLDRSLEMPVSALGCWKAGCAFLALPPSLPLERLAWMATDAGLSAIVHRGPLPAELRPVGVLSLDLAAAALGAPGFSVGPAGSRLVPESLAYLIYTSGTTGRPKAVMIEHRTLDAIFPSFRERFPMAPGEREPLVSSFAFDASVLQLFLPLLDGATVELLSRAEVLDLRRLTGSLRHASRFQTVPSLLRQVADFLAEAGEPGSRSLSRIFAGGDSVPPELLRDLAVAFPAAALTVVYGPTEATVVCSAHAVGAEGPEERTVIGRPLPATRLEVLDRRWRPVPIGVPGELWIGGAQGVGRGYLGRPDITAERFVPAPQGGRFYRTGDLVRWLVDGSLEFLGRVDQQVKVRGHRVELEEIEAVLRRQPGVREAVVVLREDLPGDPRLVGYVGAHGPEPSPGDLRSALQQTLPDYMVPWAFVVLPSLPLNANGKIDRGALPAPQVAGDGDRYVAPRNSLERAIAGGWREILGLEQVGVHNNFFELGGSSLLAVKLHGRLIQALGGREDLSIMDLFRYPTVDALARHLAQVTPGESREERAAGQARARTEIRRESLERLSKTRSRRRGRNEREE